MLTRLDKIKMALAEAGYPDADVVALKGDPENPGIAMNIPEDVAHSAFHLVGWPEENGPCGICQDNGRNVMYQ